MHPSSPTELKAAARKICAQKEGRKVNIMETYHNFHNMHALLWLLVKLHIRMAFPDPSPLSVRPARPLTGGWRLFVLLFDYGRFRWFNGRIGRSRHRNLRNGG